MNSNRRTYCFPNFVEALFIVIALFFLEYLTGALIAGLGTAAGLKKMAIADIARVLAYGVGFAVLLDQNGLTYRGLVEGDRFSWRSTLGLFLLPVLLITPGLLVVENLLQWVTVQWFPLSDARREAGYYFITDGLSSVFLVCVIAPVVEELLFRGIFLRSFLRQYSSSRAIVYSALIFGLAHMNVYQFVVAFVVGLLIGWMYERTRSLIPGMLLHAFYNTAVTLTALRCGPDVRAVCGEWGMPFMWYPTALAIGVPGAWLLFRLLGIKVPTSLRS
ncbi:CPBP family intramembrane glutamic endopeptidase [Paraburkholderia antibiotica]|uniref:CPBP family intramembrane metalloprotease n=1 Tax=Paraburkholderia antibiotica TaxID=2728839 RepID=A0A7Y0A1F2_9BURK|nr:type II CAAX endopeptidase family protein [Paraburkholderia antibiotica]NML34719.1 CPBP family intramembrane metalloprotease [Paraburkholderia antibiotica]